LAAVLRALAIKTLGRFGDKTVTDIARQRFDILRQNAEMVPKELREPVTVVVGYASDRKTFDELRALGNGSPETEVKLRYFCALARARNPDLAKDIVGIALTDEVPSGRIVQFLSTAASANDDPDKVWEQVFARRDDISKKLAGSKEKLLAGVGRASFDPAVIRELTKIAQDPTVSRGARYEAEKAIDDIQFNIEFRRRVLPAVDSWIKANGGG
jgi:aminopeptidase N